MLPGAPYAGLCESGNESTRSTSALRCISIATRDVFLVHLRFTRIGDHVVVVDGVKCYIVDVMENRSVRISVETL